MDVAVSITDVRRQSDLSDYSGEVQVTSGLRITDRLNGASQNEPGTSQDMSFPITVPCGATGSATVGGTCSLASSFNAIVPGAVVEGSRANWQLSEIKVYDGGSDGVASTDPNTLFMRQGIFAP